jgi:hypothetical protein
MRCKNWNQVRAQIKLARQEVFRRANAGTAFIELHVTKRSIAIRYRKNGRRKFGVLDDALLKLLGSPKAKAAFMKFLAAAGLLSGGHGHAGTIQERFKNKRDGKLHDTVRVWCIDAKRFSRFLKMKKINLQIAR